MFRVLSEEETKNVTRWRAPDLDSGAGRLVRTPQQANPRQPGKDAVVSALLGSTRTAPARQQKSSATQATTDIAQGGMPSASAEMLQSSYDEGFASGFAEGNAAVHQPLVKELKTIVSALGKATERYEDTDMERELVGLSMDIARLVIRREVSIDAGIMHNIVLAGLDQLPGLSQAARCVYLHPLDANVVRQNLQEDATTHVLDDPQLARGECRIESGASVVNAGVEDWLLTISTQLGLAID